MVIVREVGAPIKPRAVIGAGTPRELTHAVEPLELGGIPESRGTFLLKRGAPGAGHPQGESITSQRLKIQVHRSVPHLLESSEKFVVVCGAEPQHLKPM